MEVINENKHDYKREDFEPQSKALVPSNIERYGDHYTDNGLTSKLRKVAKKLGGKALEAVLTLYYVLRSPSVSSSWLNCLQSACAFWRNPASSLSEESYNSLASIFSFSVMYSNIAFML